MKARNRILLAAIKNLLSKADLKKVTLILNRLHSVDAAEVIEHLSEEERQQVFKTWSPEQSAEALLEMDEREQVEIAEHLKPGLIADILEEMPADDATDLLGDLEPEFADSIISLMKKKQAFLVRKLLRYGKNTAGGIMTPEFVTLKKTKTAEEAIQKLRREAKETEAIFNIFVINEEGQLVGDLALRGLLIADSKALVKEIMNPDLIYVEASADQEEAAHLMSKYDLLVLPVVDEEQRLLGVITIDDVVDVIEEEATEDMYRMVGLSSDERVSTPLFTSMRRRLPWLYFNLFTAILAALTVNFFESTIAKVVVLAVFLPIVAGQGGNAGIQTLTIIVRSMALGEVDPKTGRRALIKEASLGLLNGVAIGIGIAIIAYLWKGIPVLGLVIGLAMILNMIAAGVAGVLVPLGLRLLKIDPAVASAIFITTVTDVLGFFFFLGLATLFISWLI